MKNLQQYKVNYIMPVYLEFAPLMIARKTAAADMPVVKNNDEEIKDEKDDK